MAAENVVVDISSDEEEDSGPDGSGGPVDWVDELLDRAVGLRVERSDDVLVVDEFSAPAVKRPRQDQSLREPGKCGGGRGSNDGGDDDCLVLDSDPDKPVEVADGKGGAGGGEDDLLVVAEKGQLACRDYPHSRHLCANFPFSSSPHEKYCALCHCYVCDSPAPCKYWGDGYLDTDHCHSTDKEVWWKSLRQSFKQNMPTQPYSSFNILPSQDLVPWHHSNSVPLGSNPLQLYSATVSNSDAMNQRNQYQPSIFSHRGLRPDQQLTGTYPVNSQPQLQNVQKENHLAGALCTQLINPHTRFRKGGSMQTGFTSLSNHFHNTVSSHNHIPRAIPQSSPCTTIASQISHCPQGQQRSQDLLVKPLVLSVDQRLITESSQFTPATVQSSMRSPVTVADITQKSWEDILASLASEHGVSSCRDTGIAGSQQPLMVPSPSLPYGASFSEINASLGIQPLTKHSLDYDYIWSNNTVTQVPEHTRGKDPLLSTFQTSNSALFGSNTVSGENCLDSFLAL